MTNTLKKGIGFAVLAATISGFAIFYNKLVIVKGVDPLLFNILKNGGVALILSVLLLSRAKLPTIKTLSRNQWMKLLAIAIVGGSIPFILYFEALRSVPAINANIIQKTMFVWVAMMAIPLLGERLTKIQIAGYALIVWSNVFIGGFTGFSWSRPEIMIIAATLLWSIENVIAKVALKNTESTIVAWGRMFFGSLILIAIAAFQGKLQLLLQITPIQLLAIGGSVLFLTGYVTSWYKALSLAPATVVTSILILATPITNVLSTIFITHTLPSAQLVNLVGTVGGLILIAFLSKLFQKKDHLVVS